MVTVRPASVGNDEVLAAMRGKAAPADAAAAATRKWRRGDGFIWLPLVVGLQNGATGAMSFGQCLAAAVSGVELRAQRPDVGHEIADLLL